LGKRVNTNHAHLGGGKGARVEERGKKGMGCLVCDASKKEVSIVAYLKSHPAREHRVGKEGRAGKEKDSQPRRNTA